ncbi:MAG: hypothetical protein K0S20_794 [Patescibacteria group bacterium]|jgi:hypothetical protein|nr:hypothetical protein [Patescibacteria group bacterium]
MNKQCDVRILKTFIRPVDHYECPLEAGIVEVLPPPGQPDASVVQEYTALEGEGQILSPDEFERIQTAVAELAEKKGHMVGASRNWMPKEVLLRRSDITIPEWLLQIPKSS